MLHDKKDTSPMNEINSKRISTIKNLKKYQRRKAKERNQRQLTSWNMLKAKESKSTFNTKIKQTNLLSITKTKKTTQSNMSKKELISLIIEKIKENKKIKILNKTISKEIESKRTQ